MKLPSNKMLAVNGAIILTIGFAFIVQVRDIFVGKIEPVCTQRYSKVAAFAMDRGGQLLKPDDIQASAFGQDIGVMTNLSIRRLKEGPASNAFGVKLDAGTAHPTNPQFPQGGVSFPWRPRGIPSNASAACLTYHVFLPADFDFDAGGTLPGLFGASTADAPTVDRVDVRPVWGQGGSIHHAMLATTPENQTPFTTPGNPHASGYPRGRWIRIDQEVILNTPKTGNGITRLWVNEELKAEIRSANLRDDQLVAIQGVTADLHFGLPAVGEKFLGGKAKKPEQVWVTPFELRWN